MAPAVSVWQWGEQSCGTEPLAGGVSSRRGQIKTTCRAPSCGLEKPRTEPRTPGPRRALCEDGTVLLHASYPAVSKKGNTSTEQKTETILTKRFLTDAEKTLDESQHPFTVENCRRLYQRHLLINSDGVPSVVTGSLGPRRDAHFNRFQSALKEGLAACRGKPVRGQANKGRKGHTVGGT